MILAAADGVPAAGNMPGRFSIFTTLAGGVSLSERLRIDNAGTITGSGSLGAWASYTPTFKSTGAGTDWALGNATVQGKFTRVGRIVHGFVSVLFGSTSVYGTKNLVLDTLPIIAAATNEPLIIGALRAEDVSLSNAVSGIIAKQAAASDDGSLTVNTTPGSYVLGAAITSTVPFTWATGDKLYMTFNYEASA
jgi:hypothetical protein